MPDESPQDKVNAIAKRHDTSKSAIESAILERLPQIEAALPKGEVALTFARIAITSIQTNKLLAQCTPQSIVAGIYQAAQLGLKLDGVLGHAYLVPYKIKGVQHADLTWGGFTTTNVGITRDGTLIATTANDGAYTDNIGKKGGGSYLYEICEVDPAGACGSATAVF